MKSKHLEWKFTLVACFYYCFAGFFVLGVILPILTLSLGNPGEAYIAGGIVFLLLVAILVVHNSRFNRQFRKHQADLVALAAAHSWKIDQQKDPVLPDDVAGTSILIIANRDQAKINYLQTPAWSYTDMSYVVYRRVKGGEYKAAYVYCSVLSTKLPRVLPNVFFDSKSQGGRQYKNKFDSAQRHSLEGDFDNYFDTYFAPTYTVDSLSFITPDVMLAMEAAGDYDIEIIGDRLLLYAPVYIDTTLITDGAAKLMAIARTLQITAAAYRDDRLPYAAGKQTVTPLGMNLRRRRPSTWISFVILILYIIIRLIITIKQN